MDVLRKEINDFYLRQGLADELLDDAEVSKALDQIKALSSVSGVCAVLTDASCDKAYLLTGRLANLLNLPTTSDWLELDSSDEDCLYVRMHPEDLPDKRMLELEYFRFCETLTPEHRMLTRATCRIRMTDGEGKLIYVDNSTRLFTHTQTGKAWLILCLYSLATSQTPSSGIDAAIVDDKLGAVRPISFGDKRTHILSEREKDVLRLISKGLLSKEIADHLGISVNTVSRHRQNILAKLSVDNSIEAVNAAIAMRLLQP